MTPIQPAHCHRRSRSAFALPAALAALVLLSALVAGALFVSTEELRSGRSDVADQRALALAEWALERAVLGWSAASNTRQRVGATDTVWRSSDGPNDTVIVTATRVQPGAVWMTAAATAGGDGRRAAARRSIGLSLRLVGASIPMRAALSAQGSVSIRAGIVDGRDGAGVGGGTGLCADSLSTAGVSVPNPSRLACADCSGSAGSGVFGSPPVDSASMTDSAFARFGDETVATLATRATIDIPGGTVAPRPSAAGGECDGADPLNWGDPSGAAACADHYPIIHVRGDVELASGSVGQGILIVDGSLRIGANARFVGMVFTSGTVEVTGTGAEIVGTAFAQDVGRSGESRVTDGAAIRFASCAVRRAMLGTARLVRTPERSWIELR